MKTKKIQDFSNIFYFAEKKYDISWNEANDVFFDNAFYYGKMSEAILGVEIFAYFDLDEISERLGYDISERIENAEKVTGLLTKEEVLSLPDYEQSLLITAEFFESINATGDILIDSQ